MTTTNVATSVLEQIKHTVKSTQNRLRCVPVLTKVTYIDFERRLAETILNEFALRALFVPEHYKFNKRG